MNYCQLNLNVIYGSKIWNWPRQKNIYVFSLSALFCQYRSQRNEFVSFKSQTTREPTPTVQFLSSLNFRHSFVSYIPLSNVWIDQPFMPSNDVTMQKPGSNFDSFIVERSIRLEGMSEIQATFLSFMATEKQWIVWRNNLLRAQAWLRDEGKESFLFHSHKLRLFAWSKLKLT